MKINRETELYKLVKYAITSAITKNDNFVDVVFEYLECNGVFLPKLKIGDPVYFVFNFSDEPDKIYFKEDIVTEVCTRGFWASGTNDRDPNETFIYYKWDDDDIGANVFFDKQEALNKYDELTKSHSNSED